MLTGKGLTRVSITSRKAEAARGARELTAMQERAVCYADVMYCGSLLPLATRAALVIRFWGQMREVLPEEEQDREGNRALILAFAGFSFTGVTALIVLEPTIKQTVQGAVFFLLVSFLTYLWALNLQGYKAYRWHGEAAAALADTGSVCLVLALVNLLVFSAFSTSFVSSASLLAAGVWLLDHFTRLRIDYRYLHARELRQKGGACGGEKEGP